MELDVAVAVYPSKLYLIRVEDGGSYPQVLLFIIQGISMLETFYILDSEVPFTFLLQKRMAGVWSWNKMNIILKGDILSYSSFMKKWKLLTPKIFLLLIMNIIYMAKDHKRPWHALTCCCAQINRDGCSCIVLMNCLFGLHLNSRALLEFSKVTQRSNSYWFRVRSPPCKAQAQIFWSVYHALLLLKSWTHPIPHGFISKSS